MALDGTVDGDGAVTRSSEKAVVTYEQGVNGRRVRHPSVEADQRLTVPDAHLTAKRSGEVAVSWATRPGVVFRPLVQASQHGERNHCRGLLPLTLRVKQRTAAPCLRQAAAARFEAISHAPPRRA